LSGQSAMAEVKIGAVVSTTGPDIPRRATKANP
jgi:hypothetical protein